MRFGSAALAALSFPFVTTHGKKSFSDKGRETAVGEHPFYDVMLSYIFPGFVSSKKHKDPPPSIEKLHPKKQGGVLRNVQPDAAIEKDPSSEAKLQKIDIDIGILGSLPRTDGQQDRNAQQYFEHQYNDEEYSFRAVEDPVSMYDPYGIDGGALGSDSMILGQRRMTPTSGCTSRPVVNETGDLTGGYRGGLRDLIRDCYSNSPSFDDCPDKYKSGLECWNVSFVTDLSYSAYFLDSFNDDVGGWDVSKVTKMNGMFLYSGFNRDISPWQVGNVEDMSGMFYRSPFDQNIGGWDVSNVSYMTAMFAGSGFNQDIGGWDVSKVSYMTYMFENSKFNQDIGGWDVSKVLFMNYMFENSMFNQNLGTWADRVRYDVYTTDMFEDSECPYKDDPKPGKQPWCSYASASPSEQPSNTPSSSPSRTVSSLPSEQPSHIPSSKPSVAPSQAASSSPSEQPSHPPSESASALPSEQPSSIFPSDAPSGSPSRSPNSSQSPSNVASDAPSERPSSLPSSLPSSEPSQSPTTIPEASFVSYFAGPTEITVESIHEAYLKLLQNEAAKQAKGAESTSWNDEDITFDVNSTPVTCEPEIFVIDTNGLDCRRVISTIRARVRTGIIPSDATQALDALQAAQPVEFLENLIAAAQSVRTGILNRSSTCSAVANCSAGGSSRSNCICGAGAEPSNDPSSQPSEPPSASLLPSLAPSAHPSDSSSTLPSLLLSSAPSDSASASPSEQPSSILSNSPSGSPTVLSTKKTKSPKKTKKRKSEKSTKAPKKEGKKK